MKLRFYYLLPRFINMPPFAMVLLPIIAGQNYRMGFITCGILTLLSVFTVSKFYTEEKVVQPYTPEKSLDKRLFTILLTMLTLATFWAFYNFGSSAQIYIESKLQGLSATTMTTQFILIFLIASSAGILWSFFIWIG